MEIFALEPVLIGLVFCRVQTNVSGSLILRGGDKKIIPTHGLDMETINQLRDGQELALMCDIDFGEQASTDRILAVARLDFENESVEPLWHVSHYHECLFYNRFRTICDDFIHDRLHPRQI